VGGGGNGAASGEISPKKAKIKLMKNMGEKKGKTEPTTRGETAKERPLKHGSGRTKIRKIPKEKTTKEDHKTASEDIENTPGQLMIVSAEVRKEEGIKTGESERVGIVGTGLRHLEAPIKHMATLDPMKGQKTLGGPLIANGIRRCETGLLRRREG